MTDESTSERPLRGRVVVVTGASRGAGRGIAVELGAAGATVYVTGRSTREGVPDVYQSMLATAGMDRMPGTIEDTADAVRAAGGEGIPVRCDHREEGDVRALFARVMDEQGRLDVLVNNAWGGHESFTGEGSLAAPFWEQPLAHWDSMFQGGVRNHLLACRVAAPLFVAQRGGLIVTTTFWDRDRYLKGNLFYDLAKTAMSRLALAVAEELREHGVASVAVSPGWMRTELVLAGRATEETWRERPELARTESPRYLGRAVVALARDAEVMRKSGRVLRVGDLAAEYGFTDVDGRVVPPFELP